MIMASVCWSILPRGWKRSPGERAVACGPNVSLGLMRLCARMPTVLAAGGARLFSGVARMPTVFAVRGAGFVSCLKRLPVGGCGCGFDVLWVFA